MKTVRNKPTVTQPDKGISMISETDNLAEAETDNTLPNENDNSEDIQFLDSPLNNEEPEQPEETEDEAVETEATAEEDSTEQPEEDSEEEADAGDDSNSDVFTLPDGTEIDRDEAIAGYMRQSDYTRNRQQDAQYRQNLEERSTQLENLQNAFLEYLASQLPDEPEISLITTNPTEYATQKLQRDQVVKQINSLVEQANSREAISSQLTDEERSTKIAEENRLLAMAMPMTTNEKGRAEFFKTAINAAEDIGFTKEQLEGESDHRLLMAAYWAGKGLAADKAAKQAKAKARQAPPAAKAKKQSSGNAQVKSKAWDALQNDDSIENAIQFLNA